MSILDMEYKTLSMCGLEIRQILNIGREKVMEGLGLRNADPEAPVILVKRRYGENDETETIEWCDGKNGRWRS